MFSIIPQRLRLRRRDALLHRPAFYQGRHTSPQQAKIPHGNQPAHWPVQIRLVQPTASFLKNADLLAAADCTPVAYPHFDRDFLKGKAVMIGCPKFDDAASYKEKFAQIFKTAGIKSVTVVVMEVPCCQGLPLVVKDGMEQAGVKIPLEKVVVSAEGEILQRDKIV